MAPLPGFRAPPASIYKLLLDDAEALELFVHAANARVPADVAAAVGLSRLTALRKPGGGVRGIATAPATPSGVSCPAALLGCMPTPSTRPPGRTSLRYRPELAPTHFQECSTPLSISTLRRPSSHSTAGAPMTRSRALRF